MMTILFVFLYILFNFFCFFLMGWDKAQAIKQKRRVAEYLFFLLAFAGGAIGVWVGMKAFRHKTLHNSFRLGIPVFVAWNLFYLYVLWEWT